MVKTFDVVISFFLGGDIGFGGWGIEILVRVVFLICGFFLRFFFFCGF